MTDIERGWRIDIQRVDYQQWWKRTKYVAHIYEDGKYRWNVGSSSANRSKERAKLWIQSVKKQRQKSQVRRRNVETIYVTSDGVEVGINNDN